MTQIDISLTVNGTKHELTVEPRTLLAHALRDEIGLTGTNIGCESGRCGSCTVHLDGSAVKSCTLLAVQADERAVTTVEGLASDGELHPIQKAFNEKHGLQCGYCTPGMLLASTDLIEREGTLDEESIREGIDGNLCRCTGYQNIVEAIETAQTQMGDDQ